MVRAPGEGIFSYLKRDMPPRYRSRNFVPLHLFPSSISRKLFPNVREVLQTGGADLNASLRQVRRHILETKLLNYLLSCYRTYHVASKADFVALAKLFQRTPLRSNWRWAIR